MIFIHHVKKSRKRLAVEYDCSVVIDVSSKGVMPFVKLSPFYPHGGIPVPFSEDAISNSVEGIWQGLKVFANHDIDERKFAVDTMSGLKRPTRFYGAPKGHRKGVGGELIDYVSARKLLYVPSYTWVLENKVSDLVVQMGDIAQSADLILLDYTTNEDVNDTSTPFSHASMVKSAIEGLVPNIKNKRFSSGKKNSDCRESQGRLDL